MVNITIKQALKNTLQDLSQEDFLEFCHQLKDRREEPRVRYRDVENKSVLQITNLLVSTFTERGALPVALSLLKQINCNQEAETLYSETKACVDIKSDPTFRKTSSGELDTKPSQEALNHAAGRLPFSSPVTEKKPEEVEAEAKACVLSEGGDPRNERLVLSRFMIQFGQYKGQTFKWLLENDLSYAAKMVVYHEKHRQNTLQSQLLANKDSLTRYAIAYPEVLKEVRFHRGYERSVQSGKKGKALVGFGKHRSETLQDLYESKEKDKISYVNFLRSKKSTCDPRSKMETAVKYILQRDKKQAAASRKSRASRSIWTELDDIISPAVTNALSLWKSVARRPAAESIYRLFQQK